MKRAHLLETYMQSAQSLQRIWKLHLQNFLETSRLSQAQMGLLLLINQKQPISSSDLAEQLQISRSAVAQLLDVLEQQRYIQRKAKAQDRRTVFISLSKAGQKKLDALNEQRMTIHSALAADMTDDELRVITDIQTKMIQHLEAALRKKLKENKE